MAGEPADRPKGLVSLLFWVKHDRETRYLFQNARNRLVREFDLSQEESTILETLSARPDEIPPGMVQNLLRQSLGLGSEDSPE